MLFQHFNKIHAMTINIWPNMLSLNHDKTIIKYGVENKFFLDQKGE